ncbi:MAG: alginate export family protein [Saprospiraceae bacterium]|nr:alginate export family protein [Saprospiraceae bacterium]
MKSTFTLALFLAATIAANAQQIFDLSAQLIARPEMRRGYQTLPPPGADAAFFISQRTRLNAAFSNEKIKVGISLQDVRVWGDEPQSSDIASFGLYEGWAEVGFGKNAAFKVGRQELVYDDQRLFGNDDWLGQGRSHDAAVLKLKIKKDALHLGAAFNQTDASQFGHSDPIGNYTTLGWLWYNRKFNQEKFELSFYAVSDGFAADSSLNSSKLRFQGTVGPSLQFRSGKLKAKTALFGQFGKDAFDKKIAAFFAAASLEYAITEKYSASIGYEYVSGNNLVSTPAEETHQFNTLYGTNHKFYGYMDYFLNLPKDTKGGGLQDAFVKFMYNPSTRTDLALDVHYFLLANKVKSEKNGLTDLPLGTELDLTATHQVNKYTKAQFGFSVMLGQDALETLDKVPGGLASEIGTWGYFMLIVNPSLFKSEK